MFHIAIYPAALGFLPCCFQGRLGFIMRHKPKIEMRIVNVQFPRFIIVDRGRHRYWTGRGWSRRRHDALLYADADFSGTTSRN